MKGWFPWALGACFAILVGVPLAGAKIVPATPDHIQPRVKISFLDWIESKAHTSKAEQIFNGNEKGDLVHTLKMAVRGNPGNLSLNRELLETLISKDRRREQRQQAIETTFWSLRLSQTNALELELACRVFKHYHLNALHLDILEAYKEEKTPQLQKSYLEALFSNRRLDEVQVCLRESWTKKDPEFKLYQAAILGTSDVGDRATVAHKIIEDATRTEQTAELASRLQLFLAQEHGDIQLFEQAFTRLIHRFEDTTQDHLHYWNLLKKTGNLKEAQKAATAYVFKPRSAAEVMTIADALTRLDLKAMAYQNLVNYANAFELNESNWHAQSRILIEKKEWKKLYPLARSIRSEGKTSSTFMAYSYYLEGKALIETDRRDAAAEAFSQIPKYPMTETDLTLFVGSSLWSLGYPVPACATLWAERKRYRNSITYWELILDISRGLHNSSQILMAAENLIRLEPENVTYLVNHSTYLLTQRHRCEEALTITTELLERYPEDPTTRLNHAYALVLNNRPSDAHSLLSSVDETALDSTDQHRYLFAWMELHFRTGELEEAWKTGQQIIPIDLLPEERAHFRSMWNGLQLEDPGRFQPNLSQVLPQGL
jgi:tetratricopeptide (TPR) repeat protein